MKILHYIPSIDRTSGGVGTYMQLLTAELGKLVELHVVTHKETNPLELKNCHVHFIENNNPFLPKEKPQAARRHRVAAHSAGRQGRQTRRGQIHAYVSGRREPHRGRRRLQPHHGEVRSDREGRAEDRAAGIDDDGMPRHGAGGRIHQGARIDDALRYGRTDAAPAERRRTAGRISGEALRRSMGAA